MVISLNLVILGILISIIYYEITNISPGGIVVPGLLAMYISQPIRIIYTIVVSIFSYYIVKLLSKHFIIFGKRRFVLLIIFSITISFLLELIISGMSVNMIKVSLIGYTISGLIANDITKQGIKRTIPSLVIVMGIVELIALIINQIN